MTLEENVKNIFGLAICAVLVAHSGISSANTTYWSVTGGGCIPLNDTIQGDRYWVPLQGVVGKHQINKTGTINFICPVTFPVTVPLMVMVFATRSATTAAPTPIVRL